MKRLRVLLTFMSMADGVLANFSAGVVASFENNTYFPSPPPVMALLKDVFESYVTALNKAKEGGKVEIAQKNALKIVLQQLLLSLSDYVNYTAGNDRAAYLSSMFHISKECASPAVLSAITNIIFKNGLNAGSIMMIVKDRNTNKVCYSFDYTTNNPEQGIANWTSCVCRSKRCTLNNLPRGIKVWLRVGVSGARRQSAYSEPVMKYIQ